MWISLTSDKKIWRDLIKKMTMVKRISTSPRNTGKWTLMPTAAIGRHVEQKFKKKYYAGVAVAWDLDKDTNDQRTDQAGQVR